MNQDRLSFKECTRRLANIVYYNPGGQPVNTIRRAIVFPGFNWCAAWLSRLPSSTSCSRMSSMRVLEEMARSFHAAVQAKAISQARGNDDAEAVFVAALLNRLGNMAFWRFPYGKAKEMDNAYQYWDDPQRAEEEVLGFPLTQLTQSLNQEWKQSEVRSYFRPNMFSGMTRKYTCLHNC